ncbi:acetylxylan esterase [Lutibacter sp. B1]|uniref:glucuronyl esterase domain-containing protein n=1 Tax=Lutibacter sp. B1 TaxID=2725996 RepID=UPI0014564C36|nr:acetylxylan esterase [Lutibacter sp. B1]NLP58329.1 acetylxylan esterase [Lutibacter sp. B1]
MKKTTLLNLVLLLVSWLSFAQYSQAERDSIEKLNKEDHQQIMYQLGITKLRPGPSGNPNDANAANTDESKAKQYKELPNPLIFNNGTPVNNSNQWEERKKELFELFDNEIYGRTPKNIPNVTWEIINEKDTLEGEIPVKIKELIGIVDNSSYPEISVAIQMTVGTPLAVSKSVPLVIEFGWDMTKFKNWPQPSVPSWKEQLLKKGWAYAIIIPASFQADNDAGLTQGIIGLINKGKRRKPDDWGTLKAWSWGASKAIDYFETTPEIDTKKIAIEGLSRYGKAAIVAMAYEPRISVGFIGSSGAGGTKILRRNLGEQVENLASSAEYHWFAGNFIKYAGTLQVNDLPVDAHELIALCAPRPVFISAGSSQVEGHWVDAKGMFLGGVYASPVYELLGKKGLRTTEFPLQETNLADGEIAFRQHEGGHTTYPNWPYFIEFASRYFED